MRFEFTKKEYEYFVNNCFFSEEEEQILYLRLKGNGIVKISLELNMSESTVSRRIKSIKKKILKVIWQ